MIFFITNSGNKGTLRLFLSTFFEEDYYFHLGVPILEKELAGFTLQSFLNRKGFTRNLS